MSDVWRLCDVWRLSDVFRIFACFYVLKMSWNFKILLSWKIIFTVLRPVHNVCVYACVCPDSQRTRQTDRRQTASSLNAPPRLANIKHWVSQWSVQEQKRRWRNIKSCRQAKQFMQVVHIRLTQYAVRLSRKDLRLLVGLLTGHNTLNRHLTLLRRMDDPMCPLCGEEEDTSLHLLVFLL